MAQPLVGIAMAAYKPNVDYFVAQLESLIKQTYTNWFCVITFDSALEEIHKEPRLSEYLNDQRFEWHQNQEQMGATKNFEAAIQKCLAKNPKYICCSDQDDIWYSTKIEEKVARLETLPSMSLVHCDMHLLVKQPNSDDFKLQSKTAWELERRGVHNVASLDLMVRNVVAGAGMMMDAELAVRYPNIPSDAFEHDHWYPLVASYFGGVHAIRKPLYQYRIHGNNLSGITEYRGFLKQTANSRKFSLGRKLLLVANGSSVRCLKAESVALPVEASDRLVTSAKWDLGLGYFSKGLRHLLDDPALARACFARAAGKIFSLAQPQFKDYGNR